MKFYIYNFAFVIIISTSTFSQTQLPYFTGFDNAGQQTGWQQFRKGDTSNPGWAYSSFNSYSAPNMLAHYYPVEGSLPTNDWYVSPAFSFSSGGKIDSIRHNFSGFGIPVAGDSLAIYLLTGSPDPNLATTKTMLHDFTVNYLNDNIWHLDTGIIIPATTGQSYIAFKYRTVINWLDVLFDNLRVSGNASSGIAPVDKSENNILIYPNPANDYIIISKNITSNIIITITSSDGKVLRTFLSSEMEIIRQIDVSDLQNGIYFLQIRDRDYQSHYKIVINH
ncbi:MAG: T9SS type A sorting domain-containing protein [Bacteroidia bacterium]|nr:T9SS type A sorting domain-containing protein [Bacteroidia bacterium]